MGLFVLKEERAEKLYQKGLDAQRLGKQDKAFDLFSKAAKLGHSASQWQLGLCCDQKGWAGMSHYEAAAQQGYLPAVESCIVHYLDENYKMAQF